MYRNRVLAASMVAMAAFTLVACGNYDYKKTDSGIIYKVVRRGSQPLKPGQWLKVHYKAMLGDSVLYNTYGLMPAFGQYDSTAQDVHDFVDFFSELNVGDSAVFVRSIDSMQKRGYLMYNNVFRKGETIKGHISVLKVFNSREEMMADQQAELAALKTRQSAELEQFLKEQKVSGYQKTPKGAFVKIDQAGTGPQVDSGSSVTVKYTGSLKNGNRFDSNVDPAFGHTDPFQFVAGTGSVIEGWDDGIRFFRQGSKGKIYIPSMLGYGGNAQGDKLPAYSDLIFEIEVLEVKPASANPPASQPPVPQQ